MKKLQFTLESEEFETIIASINNEEIGRIVVSNVMEGVLARIEDITINEKFRGKGFYKMLLLAIFNLADYSRIISDNRNDASQPIYERWISEEIDNDTQVEITCENETIYFEVE